MRSLVRKGLDDYSLIDYSIPKVNRENYETFDEYFQDLSNYINLKFRYTYGSKAKKKT
jgi:hypothetical protein